MCLFIGVSLLHINFKVALLVSDFLPKSSVSRIFVFEQARPKQLVISHDPDFFPNLCLLQCGVIRDRIALHRIASHGK